MNDDNRCSSNDLYRRRKLRALLRNGLDAPGDEANPITYSLQKERILSISVASYPAKRAAPHNTYIVL